MIRVSAPYTPTGSSGLIAQITARLQQVDLDSGYQTRWGRTTQARRRRPMRRASRFLVTFALVTATVALAPSAVSAGGTPLWVKHVRNYPGGISGGVRARLVALQAETAAAGAASAALQ